MLNNNLINYWIDIESNTPPKLEILNDEYSSLVNFGYNKKLNWINYPDMNHIVYLGVININKVLNLNIEKNYYTCLLSFELDDNGYPNLETLTIPQYIISMINNFANIDIELSSNSQFYKIIKSDFEKWIEILKKKNSGITYDDLMKYLNQMLSFIEDLKLLPVDYIAYIESSNSKIFRSKFSDNPILINLIDIKKSKNIISKPFLSFIENENNLTNKLSISEKRESIKELLNPENNIFSSWTDKNFSPLNVSQMVAYNLFVNQICKTKSNNLLSINTPLKTGKITLLKSLIAEIIFSKYVAITKQKNNLFNKIKEIIVDGEKLSVFEPNDNIKGYEIVINTDEQCVDSLIKKILGKNEINEIINKNFDYFSNIASSMINDDAWALIATPIASESTLYKTINALSNNFNNLYDEINIQDELSDKDEIINANKRNIQNIYKLYKSFSEKTLSSSEKEFFKDSLVNDEFWHENDYIFENGSPWSSNKINHKRNEVFLNSLKLMKNIVLENKEVFLNNIKLIKLILTNKIKDKEIIRSAWKTYFIMVPVVITSNDYFYKIFEKLNQEDIGFTFMLNAEKNSVQQVASILFKSKYSLVMGDILNDVPKIKITKNINDYFKEKNSINKNWDSCALSGLDIVNRVNVFSSSFVLRNEKLFIAPQLKVKRNINNLMFNVLNESIYHNKLVKNNKNNSKNSEIISVLGESNWFNVESNDLYFDNQYDLLKNQLSLILENQNEFKLPNICIISPFKSVVYQIIQNLYDDSKFWIPKDYNFSNQEIKNWLYKSVGTIQTIKKKNFDSIFVILNGNDKNNIDAFSNSFIFLNRICSLANDSIYIIGSKNDWNKGLISNLIKAFN